MKFINQNDIMMFLEKPITRLSVFEIETIDAMLSMFQHKENIYDKIGKVKNISTIKVN